MNQIIAQLNDQFRHGDTSLGLYMMTSGVRGLSAEKQYYLTKLVRNFDSFDEENDPYSEHNFGKVTVASESYYWKIDYYKPTLKFLSEDPANPQVTRRVLTIMQTCEY